jgi:hypothetical protein
MVERDSLKPSLMAKQWWGYNRIEPTKLAHAACVEIQPQVNFMLS